MSEIHRGGNIQNEITLEEHDGAINAKRVSLASAATIFVVSNVGNAELSGNVTLNSSPNFIGLVTAHISGPTLYAVVNTAAAGDSVNNIGFATVAVSTPTLYAVVNTSAPGVQNSMVTVNAGPNQIGSVTVSNPINLNSVVTIVDGGGAITVDGTVAATQSGTWTVQPGNTANTTPWLVSPRGNVTLSPSINSIGFATVHLGTPTIFAVVNTAGAGTTDVTSNSGVTVYQGGTWTVTQASAARTITGNVTLSDSKTFIGLVTAVPSTTARSITGNVTLSDAKTYVGLVTATVGNTVTVDLGANNDVSLNAGVNSIGFATVAVSNTTRSIIGNVTLDDGSRVGVLGNVTLSDAKTYVGLVTATVGNTITVTQSSAARTITGNLTVLNAGTTKTLIPMPIAFALTSVSTIAVPTNTFKITNILLSANATTGVSIKSGASYLVGNASIRISLNPNGGLVESGSPDSPVYVGLAGAAAIVIEKNDATTAVAGKVIYFDE